MAFGRDPQDGGYVLHVAPVVKWPGVPQEVTAPLPEKADAICPYPKMARQGTPTSITPAPWRGSRARRRVPDRGGPPDRRPAPRRGPVLP